MSTNDPRPNEIAPYHCPYLRPCMKREVLRTILAAIIAWLIGSAVGCNGSIIWRGLGFDVKARWFDTPPPAMPATLPIDTPPVAK